MLKPRREPEPRRTLAAGWPLWGAISALFYVSGSRRARRAALRGLIAAFMSGLIGTGLKRARPRDDRTPSREAGAAAAFAVGAGLELRFAGLPIAATSAASIATRFRLGFDKPAASLSGAAIGAGIALASTRLWPVAPHEGPKVPRIWLPSHAEPSEDGYGLAIVVNRDSGNGVTPTQKLREALPKAEVVEVEVKEGDELRKALDERADGATALGVAGGDGTVNTAVQVALDEGKVLMVVPSGTFNHLTGALEIETVDDAVAAVKKGQAVGIDVATIDGKAFLNAASFGGYVEFVDAREKLEHRIGKWPAVALALIRMLRSYEPVEIEIDGKPACVWMAFIGNCRYHPSGFAPSWRERLDDKLLDFRYVDGAAPFARTRLIVAVLTGRLGRSKVYHQSVVQRLRIRSLNGPLRLARDGETFEGSEDIVIEKLPKRLSLYVPHEIES
jgi:diacylglycerol kinase family enzyme